MASETEKKSDSDKQAGGGRKWLKRLGIGAGALVLVILVALGGAYAASSSKQGSRFEVTGASFTIPNDPALLAEGERLFTARGCASPDCHTPDGGGHALAMGPIGTVVGANLTQRTADYTSADWDRAVRHGLRRDGTPLIFMPSQDFTGMSDRELGLIAAYTRSLPRVERELPPSELGMLGRVIDLAGGFVLFPATIIDHPGVDGPDPEPGRTVEYGAYLGRLCMGCHGQHLSGGLIAAPSARRGPRPTRPGNGRCTMASTPTGRLVQIQQLTQWYPLERSACQRS